MGKRSRNEECKSLLKAVINRILDDGAKMIVQSDIEMCGKGDWPTIMSAIKEWESRGLLKILKNPEKARNTDICLEMLKYIDREGPREGWPS